MVWALAGFPGGKWQIVIFCVLAALTHPVIVTHATNASESPRLSMWSPRPDSTWMLAGHVSRAVGHDNAGELTEPRIIGRSVPPFRPGLRAAYNAQSAPVQLNLEERPAVGTNWRAARLPATGGSGGASM